MKIAIKREQSPNLFETLSSVSNLRDAKKNVVYPSGGIVISFLKKNLLKMKLTFLCLLLSFAQLLASKGFSQSTARLTLNLEDVRVEEVLLQIEEQSNLYFIYNREVVDVNRKVNVSYNNMELPQVLSNLFTGTGVEYEIRDMHVILKSSSGQAVQQSIKVSGKVTDSSGSPLPGVTVVLKGTTQGTITDSDGNYNIVNVPGDAFLIFSFVGMKSQEIQVARKSILNVVMEEETIGLEEVVAIGYGGQKQKDLTGAIASVKSEDIEKMPITTISEGIQGLAPGVQVTSQDGQPGASINIKIRGVGSLGDNTPLYVVDGYPIDGQPTYLNPGDIESMSILKDASSIAIYGSKASNGVIIITTKRGTGSGGISIDFSATLTNQFTPKKLNLMNAQQFTQTAIDVANQLQSSDIVIPNDWSDPSSLKSINWQNEIFSNALKQTYNLSVRGGNERTKAAMSLAYLDHEGIVYESFYKRYNVGFNIDHKIGSGIQISSSLKYAFNTRQTKIGSGPYSIGNLINNIPFMTGNPLTNEVKDANGNYGYYGSLEAEGYGRNLIASADDNKQGNESHYILGTVAAELEIFKGLKFKTNFGVNVFSNVGWNFLPSVERGIDGSRDKAVYSQYNNTNREWLWENTFSYKKTFGIHAIDAVAGVSAQKNHFIGMDAEGQGFPSNEMRTLLGEITKINSGTQDNGSMASQFGRVSYRLEDRYLLTGTVRRDGSSKFGSGHKYGTFPSVGLGWIISEESFMKNIKFIDNLKIRGSWGEAGNQRITPYQYLSLWSTGADTDWNEGYVFGDSQSRVPGIAVQNDPQKDLTWETTEQMDLGFDAQLFNHKVNLTVDYYSKKSRDFLLDISIPAQSGFTSVVRNAGSIRNTGFEFTADYYHREGDFKWSVSANLTTVNNELTDIIEGTDYLTNTSQLDLVNYGSYQWINFGRSYVGGEVGSIYGYVADGIFQTPDEIAKLNAGATATAGEVKYYQDKYSQPGDRKFKDLNGDNRITEADQKVLGSPIPDFYGGITLNASYRNFDIMVFFYGTYGNKILNAQKKNMESMGRSGRNNVFTNATVDFMENRWTGPGTSNGYTRGFTDDEVGNNRVSSYFVEDGSFLRLRNIQIGYTLPSYLAQKAYMTSARIYISGQNLLTFTNYTGWDPEIGDADGVRNSGIDIGTYPVARSITLGLNISF